MFLDSPREASPTNERSLKPNQLVRGGLVCDFQWEKERADHHLVLWFGGSSVLVGFFSVKRKAFIRVLLFQMAMKIKGIYKGFKCISQMFAVVKEREMEIGHPTDVKHVAHIGWEGSSGSAPGWMSEFKAGPELLSPRPSSFGNARNSSSFFSTCSSSDFDQTSNHPTTDTPRELHPVDLSNIYNAKKNKNKKKKYQSSSSSSSPRYKSSSSRSSKSTMSKSTYKSTTSRLY